ncbi:heme ABC transporter ATP-binding protein [Rhodobacteraceae bacterium F11138]|nr:heme ABC transporter ATP-binding protein [Rhodobacteraceae bacterium F11138]
MLYAENITVTLRRKTILRDVGLVARPGQVTAIIGPSGAGKSTLLSVMTGDQPCTGRMTLNGRDVFETAPRVLARMRAVLPQASALAFPYTVAEVVRMGMVDPHAQGDLLHQALDRVGLAGYEARYFQELSGGEQQRAHLARVLLQVWQPVRETGPCWLFLDEPVASLDIGHQLQVMQIARDFSDQGGAVVMVMHDLNLTAMSADSVLILAQGRALVQDSPAKAFTRDMLSRAYGCNLAVNRVPDSGVFILPQTAGLTPGQHDTAQDAGLRLHPQTGSAMR